MCCVIENFPCHMARVSIWSTEAAGLPDTWIGATTRSPPTACGPSVQDAPPLVWHESASDGSAVMPSGARRTSRAQEPIPSPTIAWAHAMSRRYESSVRIILDACKKAMSDFECLRFASAGNARTAVLQVCHRGRYCPVLYLRRIIRTCSVTHM